MLAFLFYVTLIVVALISVVLMIPILRRTLVSHPVLKIFRRMLPQISQTEQEALNGPTEQLCALLNEWKITHELKDLPPEVWQFIRDKGFFGLIIPKQYGGYGFSAVAHSVAVIKLA